MIFEYNKNHLKMSLVVLRKLCKDNGIKNYSKLSKSDLLSLLKSKEIDISSPKTNVKDESNKQMGKLQNIVFQCRDFLRSVGVTGLDAFLNINMILIFKEVEKKWGNTLEDPKYYMKDDDTKLPMSLSKIFNRGYYTFTKICDEYPLDDPAYNINKDIGEAIHLLKRHKIVGKIFDSFGDLGFLKVRDNRLFRELFCYIRENLDLSVENDVMGDAYESVLTSLSSDSKELGKFFTPRKIVDLSLSFAKNDDISSKNKDERELGDVLDPTCGSGGFLVRCRNATSLNGCDIDPNHIPICVNNILLHFSDREIETNIICSNFLTCKMEENKFDTILSNPPFGLKKISLKTIKDEFNKNYRSETLNKVYPFDVPPTFLFVEKMLYHLKIGGRLCVVLPLGSEMTGSGKMLEFRKMVMKGCSVKSIVSFPNGVFSNTGVKTTLLVLDKVVNFGIELKEKEDYLTNFITFYECDEECEIINKEIIPIDRIVDNGFSWSRSTYSSSNEGGSGISQENTFDESIEMVKLKNICKLIPGKSITKKDLLPGKFPVVGGGKTPMGYHNESNTDENCVIVSKDGSVGILSFYSQKIFLTGHGYVLTSVSEKFSEKYIYYFLLLQYQELLCSFKKGVAQPAFDRDKFYELEIPIPSSEVQNYIVKELDLLSEGIENLKKSVETYKNLMRMTIEKVHKKDYQKEKFGDVLTCKKGRRLIKKNMVDGDFKVMSGGLSHIGFHNQYNTLENSLIFNIEASVGHTFFITEKVWLGDHAVNINCDERILNKKFLYFYILIFSKLLSQNTEGCTIQKINMEFFNNFEISIPSMEEQIELLEKLNECESQIKISEKLIDESKKEMKEILISTLQHPENIPIQQEKSLQTHFYECISGQDSTFIDLKKLRKIRKELEKNSEFPLNFYIPFQLFDEDGNILSSEEDEKMRLNIIKIYIGYENPSLSYEVNDENPFNHLSSQEDEELPRKHSLLQEMLNPYFNRRMPQFDSIVEYVSQYEISLPKRVSISEQWYEKINSLEKLREFLDENEIKY